MRSAKVYLAVMITVMLVLVCCGSAAAGEVTGPFAPDVPATVRCEPMSVVTTASSATVDLYIQDTASMNSFDIWATWNNNIAVVADADPGTDGTQILPVADWFVPGNIIRNVVCNTPSAECYPNQMLWYAANQMAPILPVNGSGSVARVVFQRVNYGTTAVNFTYVKLSTGGGVAIPLAPLQPCSVTFARPLAVTLDGFEAMRSGSGVKLAWRTVSEVGNAGFNIYRARAADGERTQLNGVLIPSSAPGSTEGAVHEWLDPLASGRVKYYYWLEAVDGEGGSEFFGPAVVDRLGKNALVPPPLTEQ